ncbi:phosphoprotein phosphatase 1 domain protein, partial [Necator americanus]
MFVLKVEVEFSPIEVNRFIEQNGVSVAYFQYQTNISAIFKDMNRLFDLIGRVPEEKFMFLGDYVDRGPQGLEVVILLFALKLRFRDRIYLLRGNHETPSVNKIYGFYNECVMKYGAGIWWDFQACFNRIPLAGLISKRVLCMHGGLSPELNHLDVIRNIPRPCEPLDRGLLIDLTWSDPTNRGEGWFHSIRGISYMFGKGVVQQACQMLGIDLIIRAHQVSFQQLKMQIPANLAPKAKTAPAIASDTNPASAKEDKDFIKPFTGFKGKSGGTSQPGSENKPPSAPDSAAPPSASAPPTAPTTNTAAGSEIPPDSM